MFSTVDERKKKIGIVISPPRQLFTGSKTFIKHQHTHWDTIASDYRHLGDYALNLPRETVLTRTCVLSLTSSDAGGVVDENSHCVCGNDDNVAPRACTLPRELEIDNVLVPYHKPFDIRRSCDLVFHCWMSQSYRNGDKTSGFRSRLCVRKVSPHMMNDERDCPYYDMRRVVKYKTKARHQSLLHHVIVQDILSRPPSQQLPSWTDNKSTQTDESVSPRKQRKHGGPERCKMIIFTPHVDVAEKMVVADTPTKKTNSCYPPISRRPVNDEMQRRLGFGRVYNAYTRVSKSDEADDRWDNGYWRVEAQRTGNLPRWKSRYTTHVPMDFPGLTQVIRYDLKRSKSDTREMSLLFDTIEKKVKPFLAYNNRAVLPESYSLCFDGKRVNEDEEETRSSPLERQRTQTDDRQTAPPRRPYRSRYSPSIRLCTLRLPVLLPPVLEEAGADTFRRSVLYDHAMHMVVAETDTVWIGNVRFKPALSLSTWKETPLEQLKLKPGVYKWTPFQLGLDTTYSDSGQLRKYLTGCAECTRLFGDCEKTGTVVKNDQTPHYYLMNTTATTRDRSCKREVFEIVPPGSSLGTRHFDRLIHMWACDREEFSNCGVDMPFNWWNKVDRHLKPMKLWWPMSRLRVPFTLEIPLVSEMDPAKTPSMVKDVELRHQLFGNATKLIVKNPTSFFNRSLISVEICSGGSKGGGYTLLDEHSLEVVGAVLLHEQGEDRRVYECHRQHVDGAAGTRDSCFYPFAGHDRETDEQLLEDEPAVGVHFVPLSYQSALEQYCTFSNHLFVNHTAQKRNYGQCGSRTEECFVQMKAGSFTPHDFNIRPSDVANAESPFQTTRTIVEVKDKRLGPLGVYAVMNCDPYDRLWYGKVDGTPRHRLSDVAKRVE